MQKYTLLNISFFLCLCLIVPAAFGQTGPGGVGTDSTNLLWLRADAISGYSNGDPLDTWADTSGNQHHGVQTGSARPAYETNVVNGLPAVWFDGNDDYYDTLFTVPSNKMTVFTVFAHGHYTTYEFDSTGPLWMCDYDVNTSGFFPFYNNGRQYIHYGNNWLYEPSNFKQQGNWYISMIERGTATSVWKNDTMVQSAPFNNATISKFTIGRRNITNYYKGYISELIFFDKDINRTKEIIVHNYLAAKYNISIGEEKYNYKTTYGHGLAGIGQENPGDNHTEAASEKILYMSEPSDLGDGEYIFWGHNDSALAWTTTETPFSGASQRLKRVWRVNKTGDAGRVDIAIDTAYLPALPAGHSEYVIYLDNDLDGDFSTGAVTELKLELKNGLLTAENVTLSDGVFITIGAIEVIQFQVTSSRFRENAGTAEVVVAIPSIQGVNVSADYAVTSGTATEGIDFDFTGGSTATITAGNLTDTIKLTLYEDDNTEGDENIILQLSNPVNARVGSRDQHTLTIEDNDLFYTGPGGVGDSSTNRLWLRADDLLNLNDGDPVSTWIDTSGNNFDASQTGSARPVLIKDTANGWPAVYFDGRNDFYGDVFTVSDRNMTIYSVFAHKHSTLFSSYDSTGPVWTCHNNISNTGFFPFYINGNQYIHNGTGWTNKSSDMDIAGKWYINIAERGLNKTKLWVDGNLSDEENINNLAYNYFLIGQRKKINQYYRGLIAELIFYDYDLNDAQQIIVNNYLAAKYNMAIANDYYAFDTLYGHEMAGIGRVDVSNIHTIAQSAGILQFGNATGLDDNEFLMFGHNGAALDSFALDTAMGGYRLDRSWRLDMTGDVGYVKASIDTTLLPAPPEGLSDYVLWVYGADTTAFVMGEENGMFSADSVVIADGDTVTIGMVNTVQFALESSGGAEGISSVNIVVVLNDTLGSDVTVDYAVSGNSTASSGGTDYTIDSTSGTFTIPAGSVTDTLPVSINDDPDTETEETIILTLSNASGAVLGARATHTYTISDNDFGGITGPGGVGDETSNTVWLRSSDISGISVNDPVTNWPDTSGNSHHASQSNATYQPIYKTNVINGFPIVRFDGADDHTDDGHAYNATTVFTVFNVRSVYQEDTDLGQLWGNYDDDAHVAVDARSNEDEQGFSFDGNGSGRARYALNGSDYGVYNDDDNTTQWRYDTFEIAAVEFENQQSLTQQVIGSLHPAFPEDEHNFGGDIAEMIVYNKALNTAQKIIIENYLANKYGRTLSQNDYYTYGSTNKYGLAGIGRVDASNFHTAAKSSDILTVSNATSLDDGDFLLFAHNNDTIDSWSSSEVPGQLSYYRRIKREWRFDETNDVGTYTIKIDTSLFSARPAGFSNMKLLVDADGDFSSGATSYDLTPVASSPQFEVTGMDIPDGYYLTIVCSRPVVEFETNALEGNEEDTIVEITIKLNLPLGNDVTFDIADAGTGTATNGGDDYNSVPATTDTIFAGDTVTTFELEIIDDGDPETDETIALYLSNINGAAPGDNDTVTYTIHDNDWTQEIQFLSNDSAFLEDVDSMPVIVQLNAVNPVDSTTADMLFSGTAEGDSVDYDTNRVRFIMPPGDSLDTVYIPIIDDLYDEDDETLFIELTNPVNAQLGTNDSIAFTIQDNDPTPTIQFVDATTSVSETDSIANIEVALSDYSGKTVTANYTVTGITADPGDDYTLSDGQVSISSGDYNSFITPTIINDADIEVGETFKITLSGPSNATLGVNSEVTVTIVDDDLASFSFVGPGGVGNNQNNKLWLKADSLSLNDGDVVSAWYDVSGNTNNVYQNTNDNRPTYQTGEVNGAPAVSFDGVNDLLLTGDTLSYSARDAYIVFRMDSADQDRDELAHLYGNYQEGMQIGPDPRASQSYTNGYSFDGDGDARAKYGHNGEAYGAFAANTDSPSDWTYDDFYIVSVRFEENQDLTRHVLGSCYPGHPIGDHQLGGDIAEVIVYNSPLNDAQKIIVENYLSSKYNIALSQNDYYSHDVGGGGTHYHDVAGIGQVDSDNNHLTARSAKMLRLYDTSGVDDGEFMLYGHDSAGYTSWVSAEVPDASFKRIAREWQVSENGDLGTVNLYLDTTLLPDFTAGYSTIEAWITDNGDFSSGVTRHELTLTGGEYFVQNIDIPNNNYITFGIVPLEINVTDSLVSGSEDVSSAQMILELSHTSIDTVKVDYATADITANAGSDYTSTSGTAIIVPGKLRDTVTVPVLEDSSPESNQTFRINLTNPVNVLFGSDTSYIYTILDNDGKGYKGPGGVGDLTSEINVWLDTEYPLNQHVNATSIGAEDTENEWKDQPRDAGDTLDAFQDNANNQPVWYTTSPNWNSRPVIKFDGNNDHLNINNNAQMNEAEINRRFFMIAFKTGADVSSNRVIYEEGGGTRGFNFYIENDSLFMGGWDNNIPWPGEYIYNAKEVQPNTGYFAFFEYDYDGVNGYIKGNLNGEPLDSVPGPKEMVSHGGDIEFGYGDCCFKGVGNCSGEGRFDGQLAEFISGQMIINTTQEKIISNYLAAKYGISLTGSPDMYDYESNYSYRVIGIGQESASDNHFSSQGRDIIRVSNPSDIDNNEYLFIGNNNGDITAWSTTNTPGSNVQRLAREWRADTTGNPGTVSIGVDSLSIPQLPSGFDDYVLLTDEDGDFTAGSEYHLLQANGDGYYTANNIAFNKGTYFTIAAVNYSVDFETVSSAGNESEGPFSVNVVVDFPVQTAFSVDFATFDSTASSAQVPVADFVDTSGTINFAPGDTMKSITITVNNETKQESDEYFGIELLNPIGGYDIGEDTTHIRTIYDDDIIRKVEFQNASDAGNEGTSPAVITVLLSEIDSINETTVDYEILSSSSANTSDYTINSTGTITFATYDPSEQLAITINDDSYNEPDESIVIRLFNPVNANMGETDTTTYTITDNDPVPDLTLSADTLSSSESVTSRDITVTLSEQSGYDVSFDYHAVDITASGGGVDYTLSDGTITIPAGDSTGSFTMLVTNDGDEESNEFIKLYIENPVNANMGAIDTTIYTIIDNDGLGIFGPGGVGNFSGQIDAWLNTYKSDNLDDGDKVKGAASPDRWIDQTGNDIDAYQDNAANQPKFWSLAPTWNGNPVLEFIKTDERFLEIADNSAMNTPAEAQTERTIMAVFRTGDDIDSRQVVFEEGGGVRGINMYIQSDTLYLGGYNNPYNRFWRENFGNDNGTGWWGPNNTDLSGITKWSGSVDFNGLVDTNDWFRVESNEFSARDVSESGEEQVWRTELINTSGHIEESFNIDLNAQNLESNDTIKVFYSIDEGPEQLALDTAGDFSSFTYTKTGLPDSDTIQIIVKVKNDEADDYHYFDDVEIWGNPDEDPNWDYTAVKKKLTINKPYVAVLQWDFDSEGNGTVTGSVNGELLDTITGAYRLFPHGGDIGIGAINNSACFIDPITQEHTCGGDVSYFDGYFGEFVSGRIVYNSAQQKIVDNYLAAKYSIGLPTGRDLYDYELGYHNELFGIGQDNINSNHLAAKGSGMIKIDNPDNVTNGEYMFIGHDDDSVYTWFNTEVPNDDPNIARVLREWRVDKQGGDIGAIDVHVDTSRLADMPSGYSDYMIMIDDDGDFTSGATVIKLSDNGDGYFTAEGIDFNKGDYFTVGVIRPAIQFETDQSGGPENIDEFTINVTLNYRSSTPIQVDYRTIDSTASDTQTPVPDYDSLSGTLNLAAEQQTASITLTINNDLIVENDEHLILELYNPTSGVAIGQDTTHVFTIQDDDQSRKVEFSVDQDTVHETSDSSMIYVHLTEPNTVDSTTVEYRILTGESTASEDSVDYYIPLTDTIVFPPNDTLEALRLRILDDLSDEYNETVVFELLNPVNANLGFNTRHTDTIIDNDAGPDISFAYNTRSGMESTSPVELDVILSVESGREVTVDYKADTLSAEGSSVDYQLNPGTLTFSPGTDTVKLSVHVFDDRTQENTEQFRIVLRNPVNGSLGAIDTIIYSILDNDGLGIRGPGGVGNLDNQINCWLRSNDVDEAVFFDGMDIETDPKWWEDITGNGLNAYQDEPSNSPTYYNSSKTWNGKPIIEFKSGEGDFLEIPDNNYMNTASGPQNKRTIIVPFRTADDISTQQVIYEEGGGARGLSIYIMNDSVYIGGWNYPDDQGSADESTPWGYVWVQKEIQTNTPYFAVLQFNFDESGVGTVSGYLNGEDLGALPGAGRLYPHGGDIGLGGPDGDPCYHTGCGGGESFDGYISEFLSGNMVFNSAQFKLVNNYFGAKYNVTLPTSEDLYDYDVIHNDEVFGIGQISSSENHYTSQGQGPIKITDPSQIDDGEFLLIGNDDGDIDDWYDYTETDVPGNSDNIVRVKREWRVDMQGGDVGTIDLGVDTSLPNKEFGYPTYILMIDTNDGDFTDCDIFYELPDNGDGYFMAEDVNFNKGDYFTIGLVKPTVQFSDTAYTEFETDTGNVIATMNFIPGQTYTVDIISQPLTAKADTDYVSINQTINFTQGNRTVNVPFDLIDDLLPETNETFKLFLRNTQGELITGEDSTAIFNIQDDDNDRKINFAWIDSTNDEDITSIDIKVLLSKHDDDTTTKVCYSVTGGSASGGGTDFTLPADTVTFAAGDTIEFISLSVTNDNLDEFNEDIEITLSNPINANIGDTSVFTYTIIDDDAEPSVELIEISGSGAESYSPLQIAIELSSISGKDINIFFTTLDSTALGGGLDYEMSDGETRSITISAGIDSAAIPIDIVNDASIEVPEVMKVFIDSADYATVGAKDTFSYTIMDDDGLGYIGPGGIGDADQYKLWYRSNAEAYNDTDPVDTINDQSGHGNYAYTSGSSRPTFNANAINNRPVFSFDGNDALDIDDSEDLNNASSAQTERTFVIAFKTGGDVNTRQVLYEEGGTGRGLNIYIENDSLYFGGWNNPEDPWQDFTYITAPLQTNTEYYAILEMNATDTIFRGWMNGTFMGSQTDVGPLYPHGGDIRFGANESAVYHDGNSGSDHYFTGDIMEFLSYDNPLNTAQQKIIENHFAAKFRNQIETDLSTDLYNYRNNYGYEVFGLGQDDINNTHTASKGTGIIRVDQPNDLDNGEYLFAGHDNGDILTWSTNEIPYDSVYRIAREWRITKSGGDPGDIRFAVDSADLPAKPNNYNLYGLLVDQDGDFNSGDEVLYPMDHRTGNLVHTGSELVPVSDGDYFTIMVGRNRTVTSGNWHDPATWLSGEVPANDEAVLISSGDTITVNADVEIGEVLIDSGAIVNITGAQEFEITNGNLNIDPDGAFNQSNSHIIYSANGVQCIGGMTYYDLTIEGSGAKELCGDITVTNFFRIFEEAPTLSLDVTANNYSITLNCDWQNSGTFIPQDGVVIMNGNNLRIDRDNNGPETFNKLDVQTTGNLYLEDNVFIADTLFMNGSNINTQTDTLTIGTGAGVAGTLARSSGTVLGYMQRWIDNTTDTYTYPIGTASAYRPMDIQANNLATPGYAIGMFNPTNPGAAGLATLWEDSLYMVNTFDEGYWTLTSTGMGSNDYDVNVKATGFSSVDDLGAGTRLVTRPNASADWTLDGNHADATGDTIKRNNVTTLAAQFAVCDTSSCMPNTSPITGNDTVCENVTGEAYSVINSAGSVYTWIITGGTQASGTNTNSITVDWGGAANGNIKVVEDNGCAIGDTVRMDVLINPYPADPGPITGPDTIVEGIDEIFSIADVANATSYTWSVPGVISGDSDSTEIMLNADVGSGGSDYTIQVVGANACGNSATPASKSIFVEVGVPAKPTTPTGPVELCQDSPDTVYTTTSTLRATSYEWDIIGGGTSVITGTDTAGTLDMNATYNGAIGIAVRGVNANGNGPWSDTLAVTIHEQPNVTFTVVAGFDTICQGSNTLLEVDFTAGQSPWSFDYTDGTNSDSETNIAADPYQFAPTVAPPYGGVGKMTDYSYTITTITDNRGCTNTSVTGPDVSVVKRPETGKQYYVPNE